MHKSLITSIKTFTYGIEDEKKKMKAIRKIILMISKEADENCPPIDFEYYSAMHFVEYLLLLRSSTSLIFYGILQQ